MKRITHSFMHTTLFMDQFYLLSTLIQSCEQFSIYIFWWYSERAVSSGEMSDIKFSGSTCSKWTSGRVNVCLNQFTVVKRRLKVVSRKKTFFSGSFRRSANANAEANWNLFVFQCNRWKFILEFQRQIKSHKIRLRSHSHWLESWKTRWYWRWGFARNGDDAWCWGKDLIWIGEDPQLSLLSSLLLLLLLLLLFLVFL